MLQMLSTPEGNHLLNYWNNYYVPCPVLAIGALVITPTAGERKVTSNQAKKYRLCQMS